MKPEKSICYFYAPRVHQSGGLALLLDLIANSPKSTRFLLDARAEKEIPAVHQYSITWLKSGLLSYFTRELQLSQAMRSSSPEDTLFCFGNLPPARKFAAHTIVYVQNRYVIKGAPLLGFRLLTRIRIQAERWWFELFKKNADTIWVQTETFADVLKSQDPRLQVAVVPFMDKEIQAAEKTPVLSAKDYDFLYLASPDPHKNHIQLFKAWMLLANWQIFPTLAISTTTGASPELRQALAEAKAAGAKISEIETFHPTDRWNYYWRSRALIFPSTLESLGLPMIEAKSVSLPILASEMDFVRDVCDPVETFNPSSPKSIALAVLRFLKLPMPAKKDILSAGQLWKRLENKQYL
jgi:glycosyltransferase involved in cell wall biosynthesis